MRPLKPQEFLETRVLALVPKSPLKSERSIETQSPLKPKLKSEEALGILWNPKSALKPEGVS